MEEYKYAKVLTIILTIVVIGVLILLGFLGIDIYKKYATEKEVAKVIDDYDTALNTIENATTNENTELPDIATEPSQNITNSDTSEGGTSGKQPVKIQYEGYNVEGKIEIPAINLKYPILEKTTPSSIETAVAIMYSANGLNQPGNTVIAGHNYRNGSFFGNNDKLKEGDKIYITDNSGTKIKYNIYNIYETSPDDSDFIMRETNGKREISLSTCTDNSKARLIIWAVEE